MTPQAAPSRFVIETESRGEVAYVRATVGLDLRISVALVLTPEPQDTFATEARAQRWAETVARVDPSLPLRVVPA